MLALVAALSSCANFKRLNRDLKAYQGASSISGEIFRGSWKGGPVKVYLFQVSIDAEFPLIFRQVRVLAAPAGYTFTLPEPGRYLIGALEDSNDNGRLDEGESVATVNDFEPITIEADGVDLVDQNMEFGAEIPAALAQFRNRPIKFETSVEHGTLAQLSDEKFGAEAAKLGLWQPYAALQKFGGGLYWLQKYDPERIPVLFIHGMSGYPQEFTALIDGLDKKHFQPWILFYPSGAALDTVVRGTLTALELTLHTLPAAGQAPPIFVVAHSMGGLIAHQLVREHYATPGSHYLDCLVTLASPLGGMPSADTGVEYAPAVVPSWRDVGPKSAFVKKLFDRPFPQHVPYFLYFGYGGSVTFGKDASDGTVRLSSQLRPEAQELATKVMGFDATHTGILNVAQVSKHVNDNLAFCAAKLHENGAQTAEDAAKDAAEDAAEDAAQDAR